MPILLYISIDYVKTLTKWGLALLTAGLTLRMTNDFFNVMADPDAETSIKEALKKCRKRVYAVLIAITIDSLVAYIQRFY